MKIGFILGILNAMDKRHFIDSGYLVVLFFLQGCIFAVKQDPVAGSCGQGRYEYTTFSSYDEKDSLNSIISISNTNDTLSQELFGRDSSGNLKKDLWINYSANPRGDTICEYFKKEDSNNSVRSVFCNDTNKLYSMLFLDSENRPIKSLLYLGDSIVLHESLEFYNEKGELTQIDFLDNGVQYTRGKNIYDSTGNWIEGIEYNQDGSIFQDTKRKIINETQGQDNIYDSKGNLIEWVINFLSSKGNISKSIRCSQG